MDFDPDALINGYLDETLTAEQVIALNDWLRDDSENARRFAAVGLLHDRLRNRFASADALDATFSEVARPRFSTRLRFGKRPVFLSSTAAALVVVVLIVMQAVNSHRTLAAEADLDRLIEASSQTVDRCYRIRSLNKPQPPGPPPDQDPLRVRPPIDGALLYTRGKDEHVLIRSFADGRAFVTGSNGRESWAVPPEGPVQVSADPTRYRGAAPGEKQNVPIQIPEALRRLRVQYDLQVEEGDSRLGEFSRLVARKRSTTTRGPWRVELWFQSGSDVIERLYFEGLPSPQGGPLSLELQLVERRDLPDDFFEHRAHHAPIAP